MTKAANGRVSDRAWFWRINGVSVILALLSLLVFYLVRSRPNSPIVLLGFVLFVVAWLMGPIAAIIRIGKAIRRRKEPASITAPASDHVRDGQPGTAYQAMSVPTAAVSLGAVWALLVLLTNGSVIPSLFGGVTPPMMTALESAAVAFVLASLGVVLYDRIVRRWSLAGLRSRVAAGAISGALTFVVASLVPLNVGVAKQISMPPGLRIVLVLINGAVVGSILVFGATAWASRHRSRLWFN